MWCSCPGIVLSADTRIVACAHGSRSCDDQNGIRALNTLPCTSSVSSSDNASVVSSKDRPMLPLQASFVLCWNMCQAQKSFPEQMRLPCCFQAWSFDNFNHNFLCSGAASGYSERKFACLSKNLCNRTGRCREDTCMLFCAHSSGLDSLRIRSDTGSAHHEK